jgi:hypothetical protein
MRDAVLGIGDGAPGIGDAQREIGSRAVVGADVLGRAAGTSEAEEQQLHLEVEAARAT